MKRKEISNWMIYYRRDSDRINVQFVLPECDQHRLIKITSFQRNWPTITNDCMPHQQSTESSASSSLSFWHILHFETIDKNNTNAYNQPMIFRFTEQCTISLMNIFTEWMSIIYRHMEHNRLIRSVHILIDRTEYAPVHCFVHSCEIAVMNARNVEWKFCITS